MNKLAALLIPAALAFSITAGTARADSNSLPFNTAASGTDVLALPVGTFTGTATSSHLGTGAWNATIVVDLAHAYPSGNGICAPATGAATLTAANGDVVDFQYDGAVCAPAPVPNVPHTFTGTYAITGGTGRFVGASGTGSITAGDDGQGNAFMTDSGTISY